MPSSGMLRRVVLVRTDNSEELRASIVRVTRIGELGTLALVSNVRFEVFTAVTMKNAVFWDIKTQFVPHRRHITSPLQSPVG
jgi:hypothetical protein